MNDVVVKKSAINEQGVFAARDFKEGEVVIHWQPERPLTQDEVDQLSESEKKYLSSYASGTFVLHQEPERFVNHSCDPNTKAINDCDVAIKNIHEGEEITTDYSVATILKHFTCHCGSVKCKKYI